MKAKQMLSILTLLAICLFTNAQEKAHCFDAQCGFQPGQVVYLFGDQVQLRAAPTTNSKVLKTLPIGMHVVVLEAHENSWRYKGMDHPFYKVDYKGTEGYILGGLLAIDKKEIQGRTHLFGLASIADENYLLIRTLKDEGKFQEKQLQLSHSTFFLKDIGVKGLPNLEGILLVDFVAEACGIEGGGVYLFQDAGSLHHVARLSQVADAGIYYFWEEFIFPTDEGGLPGKIRYKKEIGKYMDTAAHWKKTQTETKDFIWDNNALALAHQ